MRLWCGIQGVRTIRREWMSDHVSCDRLACRPILSGLCRNDHLLVGMWRKCKRTHCMLLILTVEGLILWGSFVDCFRLGAKPGCWRCRHVVITDARSQQELVACASHFWSCGSVIVIVIGADWLLLVVHWVCIDSAQDQGLPHWSAGLDIWSWASFLS